MRTTQKRGEKVRPAASCRKDRRASEAAASHAPPRAPRRRSPRTRRPRESRPRPSGPRSARSVRATIGPSRRPRAMSAPPPIGRRGGMPARDDARPRPPCRQAAGGRPRSRCRGDRRALRALDRDSVAGRAGEPLARLVRQLEARAQHAPRSHGSRGSSAARRRSASGAIPAALLGGDQRFERRADRSAAISGSTGLRMPRSSMMRDRRRRVGEAEQLQQFVGDPLARQRHEVVGARGAGVERRRGPARRAPNRAWKRK